MERADYGLAFLLQYENVAWYEDGAVKILDRRIYPLKTEFVTCHTHQEVAQAIHDMVTQSGGPYMAAGMGMALAAYECRDKSRQEQEKYLEDAAYTLSHARPTTSKRMTIIVDACVRVAKEALEKGSSTVEAIMERNIDVNNQRYTKMERTAGYLVDMIPQHGKVMTQCFGETIVGMMLRVLKERGMGDVKFFCPETRPYFQGARLTASVICDQGFDVTVISDNMPAYTMERKGIDVFTSAADAICMDGHVVNKVGTFQIAIAAKYHGIPYFVTGAPDFGHPTINDVVIEERDPDFTLHSMGTKLTMDGVKGFYPAFDVTPPHLVSGVVTNQGIFSPYDLYRYQNDKELVL